MSAEDNNIDIHSFGNRRPINIEHKKGEKNKEKTNTLLLLNQIDLKKEAKKEKKNKDKESEKIKENEDDEEIDKNNVDPKKSNLKFVIIIIFLVVLILFASFIIVYFDIKLKKQKNSNTNENENTNNNNNQNKNKCDDGYFFPTDGDKCQKCSIQNCGKCIGTTDKNFCIFCLSGLKPVYYNNAIISCKNYIDDQCSSFDIKENKCKSCKSGYFLSFLDENTETCQKCDIENCQACFGMKLSYVCTLCKNGYYVPDDDENKQSCQKCSVKNCKSCIGTKLSNYCYACKDNYTPIKLNNIITKCEGCETGVNEKCKECDTSTGQCTSCNDGYYLPSDDTEKEICQQCSVENCKSCSGTRAINACDACKDTYILSYGKCKNNSWLNIVLKEKKTYCYTR